jgi:hypothetical protein
MDKTKMAREIPTENLQEIASAELSRNGIKDLRTLNDLELVWVGGGDHIGIWP